MSSHGSARREPVVRCRAAAIPAAISAPTKNTRNRPLTMTTLIFCMASTNVRSSLRPSDGMIVLENVKNRPAMTPSASAATPRVSVRMVSMPFIQGPERASEPWFNSSSACVSVYDRAMDALGALLEGPRARGAFLLRAVMDPPWSMRIEDEAPLAVVAMVGGTAWIVPDGEPALRLKPGDVAVCRGPEHYTVAHDPDQRPDIRILPGERCVTAAGVELVDTMNLGVRTWGNSADGGTVMLVGTYQLDGDVSQRLLNALPPRVVLAADEWDCPLIPVLAGEITKDDPGQDVVL